MSMHSSIATARRVSTVPAIRRTVTAAAASTAILLMLAPAGPAHHSAHVFFGHPVTTAGQSHWQAPQERWW